MNYIWDVVIQSQHQQINLKNIEFNFKQIFSPYVELNTRYVNQKKLELTNDVNPYFRFHSIFKNLFNAEYFQFKELREVLFDILVHFLARVDVNQGMEKVTFYWEFIYRDIKKGLLGEKAKAEIKNFTLKEKIILLDNIYKFYNLGKHFYFLRRVVKGIFEDIIMYVKKKSEDNKIIIFINRKGTQSNKEKLKVIKDIFLPVNYELDVYWENHFGVVEVIDSLRIGEMGIY